MDPASNGLLFSEKFCIGKKRFEWSTDEQWKLIDSLLPEPKRCQINQVRQCVRTGLA